MTRRTRFRAIGIVGLGGVAVVGVAVLGLRGTFRDTTPLPDLNRIAVSELIEEASAPATIVFQDMRRGWFEVSDPGALPDDMTIGTYGRRLLGQMLNVDHGPVYCDRGRALWISDGNQLVTEISYCSPRRLDILPLLPFAAEVEIRHETLAVTALEAGIARVGDNPDLRMLRAPAEVPVLSHRMVVETPFAWGPLDEGDERSALQDHADALAMQIDPRIFIRIGTNGMTGVELGDGDQILGRGALLRDGDAVVLAEGLRVTSYTLTVLCPDAESCAALRDHPEMDPSAVLQPARDISLLERAPRIATDDRPPTGNSRSLPTRAALDVGETLFGAIEEIMVEITYLDRS